MSRGLALVLVVASAFGALGGLWWYATRRAEINFLPALAPAEWVVYPTAPDAGMHWDVEWDTRFKTSFNLDKVPPQAPLRIAGFHRYWLSVNGTPLPMPIRTGKNWKTPDLFDVSRQLRAGENRIEVTVFNSNGPPALWLFLDAGTCRASTGENWQASYAGATWRAAVPASEPKRVPVSSGIYGGEQPWTSFQKRWPTLLLFALLSAAGYGLAARWMKSRQAPDGTTGRRGEILLLAVLAGFWVALLVNNLGGVPYRAGFDADQHLRYVRYIQENKSLPLASEGWQMFQPPLYYLVGAGFLSLLSLTPSQVAGATALRVMGLSVGVAHLAVVWAALRLLFPRETAKQQWGLLLAACLPPMLYLSQYITNEPLSAALASACLYLCLRILKLDRFTWKTSAGLGVCLGAALLTKSTNVLLIPAIFGSLLWRWLEKPGLSLSRWIGCVGLIFLSATIVSGWHYARVWLHFGNPLIGGWDPKRGFPWWQDDGYHTCAYYLRFGQALLHPWYAGFKSFGDGFYSTLWGDGLLGGFNTLATPPPWDYDLMAIGYWLSLLPTVAIVVGGILAVVKFIREPVAERFLLLGFSCSVAVALLWMSLTAPCCGAVKACYGLPALVPLCAFGALGLDFLTRGHSKLRFLLCVLFGVWAINSYASFWVSRSSVPYLLSHAKELAIDGQVVQAEELLRERLESQPHAVRVRSLLIGLLIQSGDLDEAGKQAQIAAQEQPGDGMPLLSMALIFNQRHQPDKAVEAAGRSIELEPGRGPAYELLAGVLINQGRYEEATRVARQGLAVASYSPKLRFALGFALLGEARESEALSQFRYACLINPDSVEGLNNVAWKLATDEDPRQRNGPVAVKLAEQACALTEYRRADCIDTLAAAYAEAGRYADAVKTAERARASAIASGETNLAAKDQKLIELFKSGKPYRKGRQ
jgi:tetratricopeptide (TPR) repeat protein